MRSNIAGIVVRVCFVALLALLMPHWAAAQATDSSALRPSEPLPGAPRRPDPEKLAQLKERVEQLKYAKLKQKLGMDDEQAKKFFELYKPAEQEIQALAKQRNAEIEKLYQLTQSAKNDADVDPLLQNIRSLTEQIQARLQKADADLKPILTARQRAKLLVFELEFNRKVRDDIARRRIQRHRDQMRLRLQERRLERQQLRRQLQRQR